MVDDIRALADLFADEGGREYLGEPVTQGAHMLQTAALAEAAGATPALIAAALLHDVGHFVVVGSGQELMSGTDNRHSDVGAAWLAAWFPLAVTEPVRLHVAAKRFLCAVEPDYLSRLSTASLFTLDVQGGPMTGPEAARFAAEPYALDAVQLRRWDEAAKDPSGTPPPFHHYRPLLLGLVRP
jgi:gamma-butyrobetaine dioxygenase